MNWFRDLRLGIKLNLVIIAAVTLVAATIFILLRTNTGALLDEVGQERIRQEISIIEQNIRRAQQDLESAAGLLATNDAFTAAVSARNIAAVEPLLRTTLSSFRFDEFDIIDTEGASLIATDDEAFEEDEESTVLRETLFGIERVTLTAGQVDTTTRLELVLVRPLRNDRGMIIGGLLLSRRLDDEFLTAMNLERSGVELLLVHNGQQIAASFVPADESAAPENIPAVAALAAQALDGRTAINPDTVFSASGVPHTEAYLPLQGLTDTAPQAVVVIRVDNGSIVAFQQTVIKSLELVMLLLGGGVVTAVLFQVNFTVTRRVAQLQHAAVRLGEGDYSQRSTLQGRDEIGQLGQIFNRMADTIEEREDSLKDLNLSLEKRVEERTVELTEQAESLRVATARAKEAARIKGEFLANVSHELRTPLNAIIGFADMLLMGMSGALNDKQQHKLERLKENGVRLLTLINNILDITRIEARRIEVVNKPFSPHELTGRVSSQMAVLAEQRSLEFKMSIQPDVPETVTGDAQRIEQVVVNLLSNAFKFTDTGSVTLEVFARDNHDNWGFIVSDTGIGIPPHALHLIFEEFRQVDGSSSRAYKGSGLGLAITRNLVRIMDGHIAVESEPGKGSTFTVTLPMNTESAATDVLEKEAI